MEMVGLLLMAAAVRLSGVAWDGGIGAHPDERYLVGVSEAMAWPSHLDPFAVDPAFPYGHLPLYLFLLLGGADRLMAARLLTGLLDVGTVALAAALARLLAGCEAGPASGRRAALLAALFLALMPLHVQQAHFATADIPLAFFSTGALLFAARAGCVPEFSGNPTAGFWCALARLFRLAFSPAGIKEIYFSLRRRSRRNEKYIRFIPVRSPEAASKSACLSPGGATIWLAGIWAGLALGCKAGAALLVVPLVISGALATPGRRAGFRRAVGAIGAALTTFALADPFAVLEFPRLLSNVAVQAALARGAVLVPYTLQYRGTWPYLYPIAQQLVWGMGPVLGLLGWGGLVRVAGRAARGRLRPAEWVVLAWALPFFAFTGGLYARFPRYLLPLTPVLAAYAAQMVLSRDHKGRSLCSFVSFVVLFLPTALLSVALVVSYGRPHPWVAASGWIRAHLPPNSVIAVEEWDHPLPLDAEGYILRALPVFDPEGEEKERAMAAVLAEADAVVVASRRGYGALARWPDRFPMTLAHYRALFTGERGFTAVGCWGRWPSLVGLSLADDPFGAAGLPLPHPDCRPGGVWLRLPRLDESFVVYDHPEVVVFLARRPQGHPQQSPSRIRFRPASLPRARGCPNLCGKPALRFATRPAAGRWPGCGPGWSRSRRR
jgi:4-amino-4-deoxy-L-arabinose transferase-like glycosyltransferase